jgi:hypothetical protein
VLVVFPFLPCGCRLLRRLVAFFGGAAGARISAQFIPLILANVDAVMFGRFPEVGGGLGLIMVDWARGSRIPLEGQRFGWLTVIEHVGSSRDGSLYRCKLPWRRGEDRCKRDAEKRQGQVMRLHEARTEAEANCVGFAKADGIPFGWSGSRIGAWRVEGCLRSPRWPKSRLCPEPYYFRIIDLGTSDASCWLNRGLRAKSKFAC